MKKRVLIALVMTIALSLSTTGLVLAGGGVMPSAAIGNDWVFTGPVK